MAGQDPDGVQAMIRSPSARGAPRDLRQRLSLHSIRQLALEHRWLLAAMALSLFIGASSAVRYPDPVAAGGLFASATQHISDNNYRLPSHIPNYTDGGVPFAYPPLMLYALAALHDITGMSVLTLERWLPPLLTAAYLPAFFLLAEELLHDRRTALFATLIMAVSPSAFYYHIDAGGVVRAPALAFLLIGLWASHRMLRAGDCRDVAGAVVAFALTLMSHVGYAAMFAASVVVFWIFESRTRDGVLRCGIVAIAGLLLSAPWWLQVVYEHGPGVFVNPLITHRSAAGTLYRTITLTIEREPFLPIWHVLAIVGGLYQIARGRWLLPVWLVALILAYPPEESLMLAVSMLAAIAVFDLIIPRAEEMQSHAIATIGAATLIVGALGLYGAGSALATVQRFPRSDVAFWGPYFDDDDREAMAWANDSTLPDSHFMVVGNQAEWFPYFSDRTSVVGEWGAEWKRGEFRKQQDMFNDMVACGHKLVDCIEQIRDDNNLPVDYVYLPKTDDTISLRHSIGESANWQLAYENSGVIVFRSR